MGVVASPQEAQAIRQASGEEFMIVTPGVRPAGAAINDQSRIATPMQALKNGASHLVIGQTNYCSERSACGSLGNYKGNGDGEINDRSTN